jgi:uncharacterized membrane protein YagU involved in acid resistance
LAAIIHFLLSGSGKSPALIFQYIASGLFGADAFKGGTGMVVAGVMIHYLIALVFTFIYFRVYPHLPLLGRATWLSGILYGILVGLLMSLVVLPLTRVPRQPGAGIRLDELLIAIGILIICIGLPIALLVDKYYKAKEFNRSGGGRRS